MANLSGKDIGRYHVIEPIGQGGMAAVYKALDTTLEREVALKVIRVEEFAPAVLEKVLQRFEREAKTLAKLNHPNIVPIIDFGKARGAPYLVMPYFKGGTLRERLGQPFEEGEAAQLLLPLAEALAYAHRKGVLHRDIKPANILLTEEGQPMLTDFGIAKLLEGGGGQTLTGTGVGIGTPEYMAPEQGMGKEVDARADVYALGVVLYELVTGQKPYSADTPMAVVFKHMSDPLPRPQALNPRVSEACEQVLFKALAKQPEHRYADMDIMRAALGKLAAGEKPAPAAPLAMDMPAAEQTSAGFTVELGTGLKPMAASQGGEPAADPVTAQPLRLTPPTLPDPSFEPSAEQIKKQRSVWPWVLVAGLAVLITIGILMIPGGPLALAPSATEPPAAPAEAPAAVPAAVDPSIPPACAEVGQRWTNPQDGGEMVCVPAGEFWMGAAEGDSQADDDEKPGRLVYLDAYWIARFEVTNAQYQACVNAGGCTSPQGNASNTRDSYYDNPNYANYPVIEVRWDQASTYCAWAGGDLPTEAQWEKAARGTDGRLYPWGNQAPTSSLANFNQNINDTTEVGSYPGGASPYGAEDLAGNVREWTADKYSESYYKGAPPRNPAGPENGDLRVNRGGSWNNDASFIYTSNRHMDAIDYTFSGLGFRCSLSPR